MKIGKWTFDEIEWKALEEFRRQREIIVHNEMVAFLNSIKRFKKRKI